jgi:hypothetical protein
MPISDGDVGPRRIRSLGDVYIEGVLYLDDGSAAQPSLTFVSSSVGTGGLYYDSTYGFAVSAGGYPAAYFMQNCLALPADAVGGLPVLELWSTGEGYISMSPGWDGHNPDVTFHTGSTDEWVGQVVARGSVPETGGSSEHVGAFGVDGRLYITVIPPTRTLGRERPFLRLADRMSTVDSTTVILARLGIPPNQEYTTGGAAHCIDYTHDSRFIFDNDTDTYIRHTGANALSFVVGGTTVLKMTSTGCVITT